MDEEEFSYTLHLSETETLLQSLRKKAAIARSNTYIFLAEVTAIPYLAEKLYQMLPDPWKNTTYGGMMAAEVVIAGAFFRSGYGWWKTTKQVNELERMLGIKK